MTRQPATTHRMWEEITTIPSVLKDPLPAGMATRDAARTLAKQPAVDLIGCGTSLFAATAIGYALEMAGLRAVAHNAYEYLTYPPPRQSRGALLGISHTGRTPDVVAAGRNHRDLGKPIIVLTDDDTSTLASVANHCLVDPRGPEPTLPKTRSYISTLVRGLHLADAVTDHQGNAIALPEALQGTAKHADQLLDACAAQTQSIARRFRNVPRAVVIGAGPEFATAQEAALKLTEAAALHANAWEMEEAAHGTWASTQPDELIVVLAIRGRSQLAARRVTRGMQAIGATIWVIGNDEETLSEADIATRLPNQHELTIPVLSIVPLYCLAYHLAVARGMDPDIMRQDDPRYHDARTKLRRQLAPTDEP